MAGGRLVRLCEAARTWWCPRWRPGAGPSRPRDAGALFLLLLGQHRHGLLAPLLPGLVGGLAGVGQRLAGELGLERFELLHLVVGELEIGLLAQEPFRRVHVPHGRIGLAGGGRGRRAGGGLLLGRGLGGGAKQAGGDEREGEGQRALHASSLWMWWLPALRLRRTSRRGAPEDGGRGGAAGVKRISAWRARLLDLDQRRAGGPGGLADPEPMAIGRINLPEPATDLLACREPKGPPKSSLEWERMTATLWCVSASRRSGSQPASRLMRYPSRNPRPTACACAGSTPPACRSWGEVKRDRGPIALRAGLERREGRAPAAQPEAARPRRARGSGRKKKTPAARGRRVSEGRWRGEEE